MKYLLFLLLIPLSCTGQVAKRDFKIWVELSSFKDAEKFYLEYTNTNESTNTEITDSLISTGNTITFKGKIGEPGPATFYRYTEYPKEFLEQMKKMPGIPEDDLKEFLSGPMKEVFSFFLMPGEITITSKGSLYASKIDGPKEIMDFDSLKKEDNGFVMRRLSFGDKLEMGLTKPDGALNEKVMKKMDSLNSMKKDQVYLAYVRKNLSSPLALYALKESVPAHIDSADKYLQLFYQLPAEMQHWPSAARFKASLEAARNAEIGQFVKDFKQTDSLGKIITFSSFRGRYVLLDLWASWCIPCRKKHPELVTLFKKYSRENFTILGVALENVGGRSKWLKAIQQDKLTWAQVTDFKGWDNSVAKQFGVRSIPFNLLIDPEGKIIDKDLNPLDLEKRLAALFKK
jgi:thiol-disulfide isomerase/thioredoxin